MAYELNGRAMMHAITANMSQRFNEGLMHAYWSSYHKLEEFSRPQYERVAKVFEIELLDKFFILIKSRVICWLPDCVIPLILTGLRKRTVAYVERLRWLAEIGPAEEREFFEYMVRQELLQVKLMDLALGNEYQLASHLVERFINQESAVS